MHLLRSVKVKVSCMVAVDRRTKEIILPDTLQGALKHPEYFVCTCKKVEDKYIVEEITKV